MEAGYGHHAKKIFYLFLVVCFHFIVFIFLVFVYVFSLNHDLLTFSIFLFAKMRKRRNGAYPTSVVFQYSII